MSEKILLKDILFNESKVMLIAKDIHKAYPNFARKPFVNDVMAAFPGLELKARISWISSCLKRYLPGDYRSAVNILLQSLPDPCDPQKSDDDFGDFIYAPYADFVAKHGCCEEHLDFSLQALKTMTTRFSAEDAIRYFLNAFPKQTLRTLQMWSKDSHYHVRRLCSEGTRPKLPWSQKIGLKVHEPLPILDKLFSDSTRFVTRSVANHVNDIAKIDPQLACATLVKWRDSKRQETKEMAFIMRHALRTLIKQGHPEAMSLLGLSDNPAVSVAEVLVPKKVKMGAALEFSFMVIAAQDADIVVDYVIQFQNKAGKLAGKKVFKLKRLLLGKGQKTCVSKRHMLRQFMTTRTLYEGEHVLEIQINGRVHVKKIFYLVN